MAVVQGIKEKVHLPIYDALKIEPEEQLRDVERSSTLKFFVDVQRKTKLETNLQAASLLPHYNTFEARAMRVVISDLPPRFAADKTITVTPVPTDAERSPQEKQISVAHALAAMEGDEETATIPLAGSGEREATFNLDDVQAALEEQDNGPAPEQLDHALNPENGAGTIIGKLIFNTVTSLFVGEKEMIKMPTWFFPAGAGPFSESGRFTTHGEPDPMATFRFAEPVFIEKQQNFRVEIEVPDTKVLKEIQKIYGPLFIWVVLDGFMTRDVQ